MPFIIDGLNPKEKTMTQNSQPNSRTRRLQQLKQEAKAAAAHGVSNNGGGQ